MSDKTDRYKYFYQRGKRLFNEERYKESIEALTEAFKINPSEQLQIKINKIESLIKDKEIGPVAFKKDKSKIEIDGKYYVNASLYNKLYSYQKEGVIWLFKIFEEKKGCILADDMGLGKTIQMIFYLRELLESDMIKSALIIMPKSLLVNWEREIQIWAPSVLLLTYFGTQKERNLHKVQKRGGILLTTYGTVIHNWDELNCNPKFNWGVLVLDEGHKIKNPSSKAFKTVNALRATTRIVMTGTAVQNNLKELWALLDFTHQGSLLGSYPTFSRTYEKPITDSRKKDASQNEKIYGDQISQSLKKLIKPFFLRRTKEEVFKTTNGTTEAGKIPKLSRKNDLVIWLPMTKSQIDFYERFIEFDQMKINLLKTEKRSPLLELNILKKICDHPRLLSTEQCAELGLDVSRSISNMEIETLASESGKMAFLLKLVLKIMEEERKCLIFSQSKVILNIIQRILIYHRITILRLDGDVLKAEDRQQIVDQFNKDPKYQILLLTSQVGGVGLTLTGADRVVIYDLNWNPSVDSQSVDRVYRIGQEKNVVIYRLITCGTVEEKIYRRQVFKDSLNRQTTGIKSVDNNSYRYFTQNELFELFTLSDPYRSDTQIQLDKMHSHQRKSDQYLDDHLSWLATQSIFGISDHDLLFSQQDQEIEIDQETKNRLLQDMYEAENRLVLEAKLKSNTDEINLRMLMANMTISDKKATVSKDDMFIPSKKDVKRPLYNQPVMDNYISVSKYGDYVDNFQKIKDKENNYISPIGGAITETLSKFSPVERFPNINVKDQRQSDQFAKEYDIVEISDESEDESSSVDISKEQKSECGEGSETELDDESEKSMVEFEKKTVNSLREVKESVEKNNFKTDSESDDYDYDSHDNKVEEVTLAKKGKVVKNRLVSDIENDDDENQETTTDNDERFEMKNRLTNTNSSESESDEFLDHNKPDRAQRGVRNRLISSSEDDDEVGNGNSRSHKSERELLPSTDRSDKEQEHGDSESETSEEESELSEADDKRSVGDLEDPIRSDSSDREMEASESSLFESSSSHLLNQNEDEPEIKEATDLVEPFDSSLLSDFNESEEILDETISGTDD